MSHILRIPRRAALTILLLTSFFTALLATGSAIAEADKPEPMQTIAMVAAPLNINSATAEQLAEALSGIGTAKAAEIVAYRQQHGSFSSVEELLNIKGIGRKTLERNRARVVAQ